MHGVRLKGSRCLLRRGLEFRNRPLNPFSWASQSFYRNSQHLVEHRGLVKTCPLGFYMCVIVTGMPYSNTLHTHTHVHTHTGPDRLSVLVLQLQALHTPGGA